MKVVDTQHTDAWVAEAKIGTTRPMQRATIQATHANLFKYDLSKVKGSSRQGVGTFRAGLFAQKRIPVELPNVKSISWERSSNSDAGTATITLFNVAPLPLGATPEGGDVGSLDRPGYYTYNRGVSADAQSLWGYSTNGWLNRIMPDMLVRTYEGYGFDANEPPETDPSMYQSGVWLVDDVDYDEDHNIILTCRDFGSAAISQILYPPIVPFNQYPLIMSRFENVKNPPKHVTTGTGWFRPTYDTDSNKPYIGKGFTDGPRAYVDSKGGVLGHYGKHAFDSNRSTYWLSVGNYPDWSSAFEYVQGRMSARTVLGVKVKAWGGPYKVYISVYSDGKWRGSHVIPYSHRAVDSGADIHFVTSGHIDKNEEKVFKLPKAITGATKIRVTFTDLFNTGIGKYKWRAGCHDVQVTGTVSTTVPNGTHVEGDYADYTDIVKWLLAWSGWWWPSGSNGYYYISDGTKVNYPPATADPIFPTGMGRVWGDFENTGTNGPATLGVDVFDKKPVMDGISYIRDIVNFVFFIDEYGGAIWRSPNIWSIGNYVSPIPGGPHSSRTDTIHEITDETTLIGLRPKVNSRSVRERIFVADTTGKNGALAPGYNPNPSFLTRVGGWTDQHFESQKECQIMADLITLRQAFNYRTEQITTPGNSAIQVDDQVRIYERISSDTFVHYVSGIKSDWDILSGKWTYTLDVHWLGETPFSRWAFDPRQMDFETQQYLATIGKI